MLALSARQLKRVLVFISDARYNSLVRGFLKLPAAAQECLTAEVILTLAFFDWLEHLGCIGHDHQRLIVENFGQQIADAAQMGIPPAQRSVLPPIMLSIGDCRFVAGSGENRWYDLQTESWLDELLHPAVTLLSCDLNELAIRLGNRIKEQHGDTDVPRPDYPTGTYASPVRGADCGTG